MSSTLTNSNIFEKVAFGATRVQVTREVRDIRADSAGIVVLKDALGVNTSFAVVQGELLHVRGNILVVNTSTADVIVYY